jgi:FlaA1/EpsC-like NDP-sugar epimerase
MVVGRGGVRLLLRRLAPVERCVVLGDAESADTIRRKIDACPAINAAVLGRATLQPGDSSGNGIPLLGDLSALPVLLECHEIERVIIAPTSADPDELLDAIRLVKSLGVKVSLLPRVFEAVASTTSRA